jgi:hypothetical protein
LPQPAGQVGGEVKLEQRLAERLNIGKSQLSYAFLLIGGQNSQTTLQLAQHQFDQFELALLSPLPATLLETLFETPLNAPSDEWIPDLHGFLSHAE